MAVHVQTQTTGDIEILEWEDVSGAFPPPVAPAGKTRVVRDLTTGRLFISRNTLPYVLLPDLPTASLADVAGGTALPLLTIVPVPWDTERVLDTTEFTHAASSPNVTIDRAGRYNVGFNITPNMTAGNGNVARSTVLHALQIDTGGGFVTVAGTTTASYHRDSTDGRNTGTLEPVSLSLGAGDILRVVSTKITGTSTISLLGDGSNFTLIREA